MANPRSLVAFVTEQLGPDATAKAMFGEHGIYHCGVLIGLLCDSTLFLKPTSAGAELLGDHEMAPPYPGAKPQMIVSERALGDRGLMMRLAEVTAAELPRKAPRKK